MLTDKVLTLTLGAIFLLMLACEGPAAETETAEAIPESRTRTLFDEPIFWDYAASSNMLQVELAKLAAEKGSTEKIRSIAREAAAFHEEALQRLTQLVGKQQRITLPDSLGGADKGLVQDMRLLEGEAFDLRYREFIISTHNAQLDRYEEALVKADDQQVRQWIMDLRKHLREEVNKLSELDSLGVAEEEA
ncbi:DUF4142 domain-containing protein [Pontibacter actiniarum]|uniref:DUF4142 domain-containing protein n=1 Tax=Pontibacter actiniarum TaxID=323450 RepID=A0A1X9YUY0_9BACT|nr:DUF4142 domain-containing protein [Pontibacter actiniarum]ARS36717.1 hypothetical protein CA264_15530 [Pontibacter actiniarum]